MGALGFLPHILSVFFILHFTPYLDVPTECRNVYEPMFLPMSFAFATGRMRRFIKLSGQ